MQELMKALVNEQEQVPMGAPASPFAAPGPESLLSGEDFADKKAWFDWFASMDLLEGFPNQEVPPAGPDAANASFFPPLPIAAPVPSRDFRMDG
jgi:hypothetical protein